MQSSIFISHGAPNLVLRNTKNKYFLESLGTKFSKPKAILIISPHWTTQELCITSNEESSTIHDFGGFEKVLYSMTYPSPSDEILTQEIKKLLMAHGLVVHEQNNRGLDHGAWMPLMLMYPQHDIPVIQLSLLSNQPPKFHYQLGKVLRTLRLKNILLIASGTFTHNLKDSFQLMKQARFNDSLQYTDEFVNWIDHHLNDDQKLLHYRTLAPNAINNHPTDEHFLPFFFTLGTKFDDEVLVKIHDSVDMGMSMNAYQTEQLNSF